MTNENYLDIYSYLNSNLSEKEGDYYFCDGAIMSLNEDSKGEPYININYVNPSYEEGGIINLENMDKLFVETKLYHYIFDVLPLNAIISVLYNKNSKKLEFARLQDRSCAECDVIYDKESTVCVGYIINKDLNLDYESKIKLLYEVMKHSMINSVFQGLQKNINFKINNQLISNVYGRLKDNFKELSNQANLAIIKSEFGVDLYESHQKTK